MDAKRFWAIVELKDKDAIRAKLEELSESELKDFYWTADDFALEFMDHEYAQHMASPSEDGQRDIANWLVTRGQAVYEDHIAHPEKFPDTSPLDLKWIVLYLADEVYEERFGEEIMYRDTED